MALQLIDMYAAIKYSWREVYDLLIKHQSCHSEEYFYKVRSTEFNTRISRAAQFIYLNRTCWNGLYRVNLRGEFNVPKGTQDWVISPDDDFALVSNLLKRARLEIADFEDVVSEAVEGDFVFLDPPYTVKHNMNGFIKYNEGLFSWNDQIRLRDCAVALAARGVKVVVTNADHESIRELYEGVAELVRASRHSILAANKDRRTLTTELVIRLGHNW